MISYALCGSVLFSAVFMWDILDSVYFVFSTISTVGFGDIVPEVMGRLSIFILLLHFSQDSLVFLMFGGYILIGLSIYSLWIESVVVSFDPKLCNLLMINHVRQILRPSCQR